MAKQVVRYNRELAHTAKVASGVTVAEGDLLAIVSNEWVLADADTSVNREAVCVALKDGAAADYIAGSPQAVVEGFSSLTAGAQQYLSGTAGGITATRPTTAGDTIQPVGLALTTTKVMFNICAPAIVAQAAGTTTLG
jgi:hypothetical protein